MFQETRIGLQALLLLNDSDWKAIVDCLQDYSDRASLRQACKLACAAVSASVEFLPLKGAQLLALSKLRLHERFPYLRTLILGEANAGLLTPATVTTFAAESLPRLQHLEDLYMGGSGYLPSEALVAVVRNASHLVSLSTTDGFTNEHAPELGNLTKLTHLHINGNDYGAPSGLDHTGLSCISKLTNMKSLRLTSQAVDDELLPYLSTLTKLENLQLKNSDIKGPGLSALTALKQLRRLDVSECDQLEQDVVSHIAQLTSLDKLLLDASEAHLGEEPPYEHGLAALSSLTLLAHLSLKGCSITDASAAILDLPGLRVLAVDSIAVSSARAHRASKLQELRLSSGLASAHKLFPLPSLEVLEVWCNDFVAVSAEEEAALLEVAAQDAAAINSSKALKRLWLSSYGWGDELYVAALRGLSRLQHLKLVYCTRLGLQAVATISHLPSLKDLGIRGSQVEGWQLAPLHHCAFLSRLEFARCSNVCTATLAQLLAKPTLWAMSLSQSMPVDPTVLQQLATKFSVQLDFW